MPFLGAQRVWKSKAVCLRERLRRGLRGRTVQSRTRGIIAEAMSPMNEPSDSKHTMKKSLLFVGLDVHAEKP
jgi:hypothetical protein